MSNISSLENTKQNFIILIEKKKKKRGIKTLKLTFNLVPTPSVPDTNNGSMYPDAFKSNTPHGESIFLKPGLSVVLIKK